ncbi:MAG: hemerythrin family protein [Candidatus Brocadiaceae bacterium]|nr:hemerythrin family protein [Candidatus Brocadiaceae bacterium]
MFNVLVRRKLARRIADVFKKQGDNMPLINWNESMSVNIEGIDSQHKDLVGIINTLFDAMKAAKGYDALEEVLNKLIDYVHYHFETEEAYFDRFEYPESQIHKDEHKYFTEQVNEFKKALAEGELTRNESDAPLVVGLWRLLKDWFVNHVLIFDKKYAPLFRESGLK